MLLLHMCVGGNERFILAKFNEFFRQSRLWWALQQLDGVLGWLKWGHKIPPHDDVKRKLSILGLVGSESWYVWALAEALEAINIHESVNIISWCVWPSKWGP